jgi:hypothetical protein
LAETDIESPMNRRFIARLLRFLARTNHGRRRTKDFPPQYQVAKLALACQ